MNKKSGAEILLSTLQKLEIDILVGYTGGAIMPTFDKLPLFPNLRFFMSRTEQGASFIAQGYSRSSGKLCPVLTTSGPGAMNTVTGVADAIMDSVPLLVITGQVASGVLGTDAFQESDVIGVMYPITKYAIQPLSASEIPQSVVDCVYISTNGRPGPVCLDIPKDVQIELGEENNKPPNPTFDLKINSHLSSTHIEEVLKLINESNKPVILAGHGIILANAGEELKIFAEKYNIPVSVTLHGLSSFESDTRLYLGMMGMHGEIEANRAIQNADLIIALGMRFDDRVTGKLDEYAKNAKVIHVDIDQAELGKNVRPLLSFNADVKTFLKQINLTETIHENDRKDWIDYLSEQKNLSAKHYSHIFEKGYGPENGLLMSRIVHELSVLTNGNDNIVSDVGQHQMISAKFYKFMRFNTWFNSGGAGTMGFALPAAIGVKLARPNEEVWAINGDGGFQMNIQELGTIMQYKININILIMNNSFLGMVKQWQNIFYEDRLVMTELDNPDFGKIAQAYKIPYKKVSKVEKITPALQWSKSETGPTIVEFICDKKEIVLPMVPSNTPFEKMIISLDEL